MASGGIPSIYKQYRSVTVGGFNAGPQIWCKLSWRGKLKVNSGASGLAENRGKSLLF